MVKNPMSKPGYCEEFDMEALRDLADMAFRYVVVENGGNMTGNQKGLPRVPNGNYSDFSCNVWELMTNLIRDGMKLQESLGS